MKSGSQERQGLRLKLVFRSYRKSTRENVTEKHSEQKLVTPRSERWAKNPIPAKDQEAVWLVTLEINGQPAP